jgi:hypothetical protein
MKRIALIVTSIALLAASCGAATAAVKVEVTMPTSHPSYVLEPYPAQLVKSAHGFSFKNAHRLLNPVSPGRRATSPAVAPPAVQNASRGVVDLVNSAS